MNNTSPFSFLESLVSRFQPPAWVVDEGQQRLVLFLNHVLMQEKQAQDRLLGQKGRVVHVRWGLFAIDLVVTPAGLVDRAPPSVQPDLLLSVATESPLVVMQSILAGKRPPVTIEGDVQLAAEVGWLAENLRWDAEEDLSRLIGDAPAHALADAGRRLLAGLKQFRAQGPLSPESSFSSADSGYAPERSAVPPQASSAPSGGSAISEATSVGANERSEAHKVASAGAIPYPTASA
jgi:ubiquinone biosynthesis protein UbiJ